MNHFGSKTEEITLNLGLCSVTCLSEENITGCLYSYLLLVSMLL